MTIFRTNENIFKNFNEVFNENWMDSDKIGYPPTYMWDYSRELKIEDIEIWEVIYEDSSGIGIYASWLPYAEFYMIKTKKSTDLYYGKYSLNKVIKKIKELNVPISTKKIWVEEEDMWLYK